VANVLVVSAKEFGTVVVCQYRPAGNTTKEEEPKKK
jgi:hypothetical protein